LVEGQRTGEKKFEFWGDGWTSPHPATPAIGEDIPLREVDAENLEVILMFTWDIS
jgi:hypothetical protein